MESNIGTKYHRPGVPNSGQLTLPIICNSSDILIKQDIWRPYPGLVAGDDDIGSESLNDCPARWVLLRPFIRWETEAHRG